MPTAGQIERAAAEGGLDGIVIASPANPTGTMLSPERVAEIATLCERLGIWFISDEIYHGLTYGMPEATAAACGATTPSSSTASRSTSR